MVYQIFNILGEHVNRCFKPSEEETSSSFFFFSMNVAVAKF